MPQFKLRHGAGSHSEMIDGELVTFKAKDDDIIDVAKDLVKMFPLKFEEVITPQPVKRKRRKSAPSQALGKDVTKRFTIAVEEGIKVFCKGDDFFITEPDTPNKPIHDGSKTRTEVKTTIREYLKSQG